MKEVLALATGKTYNTILETGITAHPAVAPYPRFTPKYIIPIKQGGVCEFLYEVKRKLECLPEDVYQYEDILSTDELEILIRYHKIRKASFGYSKENTKYTFYILGKRYNIEQPYERKGIQISVKLNIQDIPVEILSDDDVCYIESINEVFENDAIEGKEKQTIVKTRVNQGLFREKLLVRYKRCCLCNVNNQNFLVASHIKPWSVSKNREKIDVDNGLLLCPNHDKLFDTGYISFKDDGEIMLSKELSEIDIEAMNINVGEKLILTNGNKKYLEYHREEIFKQ